MMREFILEADNGRRMVISARTKIEAIKLARYANLMGDVVVFPRLER